jgi:hypothetical protein
MNRLLGDVAIPKHDESKIYKGDRHFQRIGHVPL